MIRLLQNDLKRFFNSPILYITVICGIAFILRPLMDIHGMWKLYTPMELLAIPLAISDFTPFAALFCVFPFADVFAREYSSGYTLFILTRKSSKQYALGKCISVAISGGVVMGIIMTVTEIICVCLAGTKENVETLSFLQNTIWAREGLLSIWNGNLVLLLRVFIAVIFGALWASVGLLSSVIIPNRYTVFIVPLVVYQLLWFLLNGLPVNPVYLLRGDSANIPSLEFLLLVQVGSILLCSAVSYIGILSRVRK